MGLCFQLLGHLGYSESKVTVADRFKYATDAYSHRASTKAKLSDPTQIRRRLSELDQKGTVVGRATAEEIEVQFITLWYH